MMSQVTGSSEHLPTVIRAASSFVWDFDGVIADTEPVHKRAYEIVCEANGSRLPSDWYASRGGVAEPVMWPDLQRTFGIDADVADLSRQRAEVLDRLLDAIEPAWFVRPVLDIDGRHQIVSSGGHALITRLLDRWKLRGAFTEICGSDSPSTPSGQSKRERLDEALSPGVVLLEDQARYLEFGRERGAVTVGVQHSCNELGSETCDVTVRHDAIGSWQVHVH